ncbi:hypothetical protein STPH1_0511 [Streptomyces sp. OM5714]|nr:hypothetical protein STPH1_0511 [Streptomyces sp. OM5714]
MQRTVRTAVPADIDAVRDGVAGSGAGEELVCIHPAGPSAGRLARRAVDARQRLVFGGPAHRDRTGVAADEPDRLGRDRRRHRRPGPATGAGTFVCHNGSRVSRSPSRRLPWPRCPVGSHRLAWEAGALLFGRNSARSRPSGDRRWGGGRTAPS